MPAATGYHRENIMATDWSEAAKARRSASAKKAAETRKANQRKKLMTHLSRYGAGTVQYPYFQNSRVARWALSGVSVLAMMRANPKLMRG